MVSKSLICGCVLLTAAASASAGTVRVTTELVDTAGGSLDVVEVGQEFEVFVLAEDTRSKPTGFRGGTLDILWDAAIIRCDEDLGSDPFTEDVTRLGIVDDSVWGGPVAGAMGGSGMIELLTFTQAPPAIRPLGAGSSVLLCRVRFAAIETGDSKTFLTDARSFGTSRNVCGIPPIYAMLSVMPPCTGKLLHYAQWPDPNAVVTFAAMVFDLID